MKDFNLLGACGLYCGACTHYRATFPEHKHLLDKAKDQGYIIEGYTCQGCRSEILYIHKGCDECTIRACVEKRELLHCGECKEMPCDKLVSFKKDGHIHHLDIYSNLAEIEQIGSENWLVEQKERWKCKCGFPYSWYEKNCMNCSEEVNSYESRKKHVQKEDQQSEVKKIRP